MKDLEIYEVIHPNFYLEDYFFESIFSVHGCLKKMKTIKLE